MRKKQIQFYYSNNISPTNIKVVRILTLNNLLEKLENVNIEDDTIEFYCNDVNTEYNENIIKEQYNYLRDIYDLKPFKQLPQKKVSSLLIRILKHQGYNITNFRKYYRDGNKVSTQGFYTCKSTSL